MGAAETEPATSLGEVTEDVRASASRVLDYCRARIRFRLASPVGVAGEAYSMRVSGQPDSSPPGEHPLPGFLKQD